MQTHVQAPAEKPKQQHSSALRPAQLLAEPQSAVEDSRPELAQLKAMRALMNSSPRQQQLHILQTKVSAGAQPAQARAQPVLQMKLGVGVSPQVVQRRVIDSSQYGQFDTDDLSREEILAIYKQLLRTGGDRALLADITNAIRRGEFQGDAINLAGIDEWSTDHTISVAGVDYTLSELNHKSQEFYYTEEYDNLDELWTQLNELDDLESDADQAHLQQLKNKVHNAWEIGEHLQEAEDGWLQEYGRHPGQGGSLHDLVYNTVIQAMGNQAAIAGMSYDKIYQYNPETQLVYCLKECRDDTEEVLALCLYTSYFYGPLNSYFRGQLQPDNNTNFGRLILRTAQVLRDSYEDEDDTDIADRRYRLELKSGWINDNVRSLDFAALTSMHPDIAGIKNMWGDVADGTFGPFDRLALLVFEGTAKIKRPDKKYFTDENEDLMGPGTRRQVIASYTLRGNIPGIGQKDIRVFHLSQEGYENHGVARLSFDDVV